MWLGFFWFGFLLGFFVLFYLQWQGLIVQLCCGNLNILSTGYLSTDVSFLKAAVPHIFRDKLCNTLQGVAHIQFCHYFQDTQDRRELSQSPCAGCAVHICRYLFSPLTALGMRCAEAGHLQLIELRMSSSLRAAQE